MLALRIVWKRTRKCGCRWHCCYCRDRRRRLRCRRRRLLVVSSSPPRRCRICSLHLPSRELYDGSLASLSRRIIKYTCDGCAAVLPAGGLGSQRSVSTPVFGCGRKHRTCTSHCINQTCAAGVSSRKMTTGPKLRCTLLRGISGCIEEY